MLGLLTVSLLPVFSNSYSRRFECAPDVPCAAPFATGPDYGRPAARNGLVAVKVSDSGKLKKVASWTDTDDRRVVKLIPLGDGRLVALDYRGVRIFDADSLKLYGSALYR